jgi:Zn-dependent M28 family amino/carboxypeptidase
MIRGKFSVVKGMKRGSLIQVIILSLAVLILFHSCTGEKEDPKESLSAMLVKEIKADSLEAYVKWMEGMGTRFALAPNRKTVATALMNKFKSFGYSDTKLDSFQITKSYNNIQYIQWQYNVIAKLEGSKNTDSLCIMGGHYDNILRAGTGDPFTTAYGANDNASGIAAALEVARVFKLKNYEPRNTIVFIAFGAEEFGLLGSKAYAENARNTGVKIKMMLNNDMIAYMPSSVTTDWVVDIMDYENSSDLRYRAQDLLHKYTVLNHVNINTYNRQSDSYPFFLNGYQALFFFGNASDPNYHTPNDLSGQCNFDFCAEIVKISCAMLVDANTSN